ncbi:MAG: tyrosine--tRNA ligase [Ruminococcaceae bacterium]|nr:tyrosine--tRNA ligase [Oscillospiraceae bacterium]
MRNVFDILKERDLIAQTTHEEEIRELLGKEKVTFYIGFDPTADSLHVGHFLQMMVMAHMQRAGHRPIAILGGGTAMIGDPTGKSDMRKMLTREQLDHNAACFKEQLSKFVDFGEDKALMLNNADWFLPLNYMEFLRDIAVHFSVNRMLTAECFKSRMEKGLTFLEFNYMLLQSYDFYKLNQEYGCVLELGGDDQWSNILGGIDLIRKKTGKQAYGMTFTLLTTSQGKKMGKTESGALWLDPEKTSPYDFYQYFRNVDDEDVIRCLKLITFVPMEEINRLAQLEGQELNEAKRILAFEVTKLVHGEAEAKKAMDTAENLFSGGGSVDNMPTTELVLTEEDYGLLDVMQTAGLIASKGEGRRLIEQGGVSVNDEKITDVTYRLTTETLQQGVVIKKGKKVFHRVIGK